MPSKSKGWQTTNTPNLLKHGKSGRYYARFQIRGKTKFVALKTTLLSTAKLRLLTEAHKADIQRRYPRQTDAGDLTLGIIAALYRENYQADTELTPAAKKSRDVALKRVETTWPNFTLTRPAAVTLRDIQDWTNALHSTATFAPPGAKSKKTGYSPRSVNQALETMRRLLAIAVQRGALHASPFDQQTELTGPLRKRIIRRKLELPSNDQIRALFGEIETPPVVQGHLASILKHLSKERLDTGEFARFMAYSGARKSEAAAMTWEHVKETTLIIPGTKSESSRDRVIPQISAMKDLLARMRARRADEGQQATGPMFRVSECQKTLTRACTNLKIKRLTHHDLRHYFATVCIEAGVDIPTVSKWLGHSDGGALAMRTYGHIRQDHALAQAAKIAI